jgi:hypothetical protein
LADFRSERLGVGGEFAVNGGGKLDRDFLRPIVEQPDAREARS